MILSNVKDAFQSSGDIVKSEEERGHSHVFHVMIRYYHIGDSAESWPIETRTGASPRGLYELREELGV